MKNKILAVTLGLLLWNCNTNTKTENPEPLPHEIVSDTLIVADVHTSRNSLDYLGIYKGKLPCADCEGIETYLQLSEDFTYLLVQKYLGKTNARKEKRGVFSWNDAENGIILENSNEESNQYFVGENYLIQLDSGGQKPIGKLAERYVLNKLSETQAAKTDALPKKKLVPLK